MKIKDIRVLIDTLNWSVNYNTGGTAEENMRNNLPGALRELIEKLKVVEIPQRFEDDIKRKAMALERAEKAIERWKDNNARAAAAKAKQPTDATREAMLVKALPSEPFVQEMEHRRTTLGDALYIRIYTRDYRQLAWSEVWKTFSQSYPDQWAVQMFPPASELVDEQNIYHLFVLESEPRNLSIKRR